MKAPETQGRRKRQLLGVGLGKQEAGVLARTHEQAGDSFPPLEY